MLSSSDDSQLGEVAILSFLALFFLRICSAASADGSSIDESTLLALKAHINSDILATNWSQETSFCSWIGVSCSHSNPRVTGLNLSNMGLQGSIAREIGNLSFLEFLDISSNSISGLIPAETGSLQRLRVLDMAFNKLNYHIPQSLGLLRNLENLDLSNNYLSEDIPESLSACVQLNTLDLSNNSLTGNIPAGFGNFSELQLINLTRNQLTGELPTTIFNLSSLLAFSVADNQLSGSIPKDTCNRLAKLEDLELAGNLFEGDILQILMGCRSLKIIFLRQNKFTGTIPREMGNFSAVVRFTLGGNAFTGTLPPAIVNLSNLVLCDIAKNTFHGTIPSEIGNLSTLRFLNLGSNNLIGEVPQSVFNLSRLQVLSLAHNNLSGTLPVSIDKGLPNIENLILEENKFYGEIPTSISNLSRLIILELGLNSFTGHIPITLGNLGQLQTLSLMFNQLSNNLSNPEQDFLSSLKSCEYLSFVQLSGNPITGVLPKSIASGNLSVSLENFVAESCRIISPLPNEIGNLSNLLWLNLGYNDLTGDIPTTLGQLRNLQKLEIHGNKFQGSISSVMCNLNNLSLVNAADNNFFGELPSCLGNIRSLIEIYLANNEFNSSLPSSLWFNEYIHVMDFSNNFLDGFLLEDIGNMMSLKVMDLSGNKLTGKIPTTISRSLLNLSLSNNKFSGGMSDSLADAVELQHLDLSHNNLYGPIPKSLEALAHLRYFNVSFNELSGEIPYGGPFVNYTAEFFTGNKGLCGEPKFKVRPCKRSTPPSEKKKLVKFILAAIAPVVVVALVLILVVKRRGRKFPPSFPSYLPLGKRHERISYLEILRATSNLDEENLIGRGIYGSVYKGSFSDGLVAVVKVFNLDVQGALKSFDVECRILRNIRHRNLVKVITSCSNLDFKALMMAFMPNGNLEKWLYSVDSSLNISQRLGIMIDVAYALEYLHEGYSSSIVHCDLKPNNILLDEDMVAHVGDFGIAKLLTEDQRMQQTRTLGTIGYMAPEYGSEGLISAKVDVYSYGILLMEVISRRKPTDEMFSGELTIRKWISESSLNSILEVGDNEPLNVDDRSNRAEHEICFTSTIKLALECTTYTPKDRPNMKDVLAKIKRIKLKLEAGA